MRERVTITHEFYYPPLREWLEKRIYPTADGGLAIFQMCITERKRTEKELGELTREEVLGKNLWEMFPAVLGSVFDQKTREALREHQTVHLETHPQPSDRWVEVHAYPSEEGLAVYSRDITARKRAEEKLAYQAHLL